MKFNLLIFSIALSLYFNPTKAAQNSPSLYQAKMDSINHLIENYQEEDEKKVKLLNKNARLCFYNHEFHEGFVASRTARELSKNLSFHKGMLKYYLTMSNFQIDEEIRTFYHKNAQFLTIRLDDQLEKIEAFTKITDYARDKIFQPFFTTKPTGQETGLCLSYDIVKRGHSGTIELKPEMGRSLSFSCLSTIYYNITISIL